jgi:hypothetical protein
LLPMTDRDKDVEILALRHQIGVLHRQLGGTRCGSLRRIGRCSPRSCTDHQGRPCRDSVYWRAQTLSYVGTANSWHDAMPRHPIRNARGGLALSGPFGSLFYGWPRRTSVGAAVL